MEKGTDVLKIKAQMFDLINNRESIIKGANQAIAKINEELQELSQQLAVLEQQAPPTPPVA